MRKSIWLPILAAACLPVFGQVPFRQQAMLMGTGGEGSQGWSVALSADGSTAIVGGPGDNNGAGAAWIFTRSGGVWAQQAKLVGTGGVGVLNQGVSVALSADGNTAIVGGPNDDNYAGAVWVFTNSAGAWTQQGSKLVGAGAVGAAWQGVSVALSADGNAAIVGGMYDASYIGAAWVFERSAGVWTQQGSKLVGTGAVGQAQQGASVALSGDGNTALLGGSGDNNAAGAAWIFTQSAGVWTQQGNKLVGTGAAGQARQGGSVALSADGNTALLGGSGDNVNTGAAWVFGRLAGVWTQQGSKLVGSGAVGQAFQAASVALSGDGNTALLGGWGDNNDTGAAWAFTRSAGLWTQLGSKLVGTGAWPSPVASAVALSGDGNTAIVGGPGYNPNPGAAWVFVRSLQFVPVTPCRVVDTRDPAGPFGGPTLDNDSRDFPIPTGACNIPTTAFAYSLNVTAVPHGPLYYLTIWPTGQPQPVVSTLNSTNGINKADAAFVASGSNGSVSVYANGASDVVLDINGYFVSGNSSALAFYPVTPCRLVDTRWGDGPMGGPIMNAGETRTFPLPSSSCGGIPASAQSYSLNFTVVPSGPLYYLTTWPTGEPQPVVSTLNASSGLTTANAAIVAAGNSGDINVFVDNTTHVVIDINGYFAPPGTGGLSFYAVSPCRSVDTRNSAPLAEGQAQSFLIAGTCGLPTTAQAFSLNATVVPLDTLGYLTLWPTGEAQPVVSTLNSPDGSIDSNAAIVPTLNGSISAYASDGTQLILDTNGYFAP